MDPVPAHFITLSVFLSVFPISLPLSPLTFSSVVDCGVNCISSQFPLHKEESECQTQNNFMMPLLSTQCHDVVLCH